MSDDMKKLASEYNEKRKIFSKSNECFFPSWKGGGLTSDQIDHYLKNAWKKANPDCKQLPRIRTYDLSHSHASLLIEMGFSPLLIADRLGHEKVQTTMDTYSHLYPSKQAEVATKLDILMGTVANSQNVANL